MSKQAYLTLYWGLCGAALGVKSYQPGSLEKLCVSHVELTG